jgi:hypothetical protein
MVSQKISARQGCLRGTQAPKVSKIWVMLRFVYMLLAFVKYFKVRDVLASLKSLSSGNIFTFCFVYLYSFIHMCYIVWVTAPPLLVFVFLKLF